MNSNYSLFWLAILGIWLIVGVGIWGVMFAHHANGSFKSLIHGPWDYRMANYPQVYIVKAEWLLGLMATGMVLAVAGQVGLKVLGMIELH